ncbi:MAG: hypothetical protein AMXMBFR7_45790 [Planctomycetota bacterium]
MAEKQFAQTVGFLAGEDDDALRLEGGDAYACLGRQDADQFRIDLRLIEGSGAFGAHEKMPRVAVDEFLVADDIESLAKKHAGYRVYEAGAVGAVDQNKLVGAGHDGDSRRKARI